MTDSTVWWILAAGAVALELVTGTFFLLMIAMGLAAGALAAHMGGDTTLQLVCAAVVGSGAVALWGRWRRSHPSEPPAPANRDVNLDIGQTVHIDHWDADATARVRYRGAEWTVRLQASTANPATGRYRIVAVEGSELIVDAL